MRRALLALALAALALAAPALAALAGGASAGDIVVTAPRDFAEVKIVTCRDRDDLLDQCSVVFDSPMTEDQTYRSNTGRLCYKHEVTAGDIASGWEKGWRCLENPTPAPLRATMDAPAK